MNITRNVNRRVIKIRYPRPEDATDCVSKAGDSYHAARDHRTYFGQFLKNRRLLRDDRNAGAGIEKQQHPKRPPLPGLQRFAQHVSRVQRVAKFGVRLVSSLPVASPPADFA